jgi:hypothetical protein
MKIECHCGRSSGLLRLVKLALAESSLVAQEQRARDLLASASEWQETIFGHCSTGLDRKKRFPD